MNLVRVALVCNLDGRWLQLDFDNGYKTMINVDLKAKELFALRPAQPQETEERAENSPASPVQQLKAKIPQNIMERLEAVSTIIGGISVPSREELDCAVEELDYCIAELSAMR